MKRWYAALTVPVLATVVGLSGCNSTPAPAKTGSVQEQKEETPKRKEDETKPLSIGEVVSVPNGIEFSIDKAEWVDEISPLNPDWHAGFTGRTAPDGEIMFKVTGSLKNLNTTQEYLPARIIASFKINDSLVYPADVARCNTDIQGDLQAGATDTLCIYASVPMDVKDSFTKAEVYLTIHDVDYPENPNDAYMQGGEIGRYVATFSNE